MKVRVACNMRSVVHANTCIDILTPTKQVPDVHSKAQNTNQNVIEISYTQTICQEPAPSVNLVCLGIVTLK